MGATGKFADTNLADIATVDPATGDWAVALPLEGALRGSRYKGEPARCEDCTDLANSQGKILLARPWTVSLFGFLFHTMSLAAEYRLTFRAPGGTWEDPAFVTEWMQVYGRLYDSFDLPWEAGNWWSGQVTQDEINLVNQHRFFAFEDVLADAIWIEINDVEHPDETFDIGGLWVSSTFTPELNFQRGHDLTPENRSKQDESPSGRIFTEVLQARRVISVTYDANTTAEAHRWLDAALRAGVHKTVIFIPDSDDEPGSLRDAFPANFAKPPGARFNYPTQNPVAPVFREILA